MVSDERSAAYMALGMAQSLQEPVVLICTSGTAALNFYPAIAEAFYQKIPLLIFTGDRPPEWIDQGNGQSIRQFEVFRNHVKASYQMPLDYVHKDSIWQINRNVNEAILKATTFPFGPIHINFPFREPFYPLDNQEIKFSDQPHIIHFYANQSSLTKDSWQEIILLLQANPKKLILAGFGFPNRKLINALNAFQYNNPIPVICESTSNLHKLSSTILQAETILKGNTNQDFSPQLLITFGGEIISKHIKNYFRNYNSKLHFHISNEDVIYDPLQSITHHIKLAPEDFFIELSNKSFLNTDSDFLNIWKQENEKLKKLKNEYFKNNQDWNELSAIHRLIQVIPANTAIHVGNSMPIRYFNILLNNEINENIEIFSNRGTSGIDGSVSSAIGGALVNEKLNVLLLGDMSFFYDRNAFWIQNLPDNLRIIVFNNHGGGIFRLVEGSSVRPELETYFETKQNLKAIHLAQEYGIKYYNITNLKEFEHILPDFLDLKKKIQIIEIETNTKESANIFKKFISAIEKNK